MTYANKKKKKRNTALSGTPLRLNNKERNSTAFYVNFQIFYLKNCIFFDFLSFFFIFSIVRRIFTLLHLILASVSIRGYPRSYNHF